VIGEIDISGVLLPPLLVWVGVALVISAGLRWVLGKLGAYRYVWHRPLFDLALLVILTGLVTFVVGRVF
jgi:hypothetical protein